MVGYIYVLNVFNVYNRGNLVDWWGVLNIDFVYFWNLLINFDLDDINYFVICILFV